ncbi:MAG: PrsW family intramembrane metalloprotease [Pseudarthrobacter sp.]
MSTNPYQRGPGQAGGPAEPQDPFPGQANPSWMGRIEPEYYRPAPGTFAGPLPVLGPPEPAREGPGRRSAGLLALTVGGAALAFLSLLLVVPFLVASTGVGGFIVGFVVSLVPLSVVLLTVHAIDRWEPEPKRLLFFAFTWGAAVSVAVTLLIQPFFALTFQFSDAADLRTYLATVEAPVVEEFAKSLGLLLLLLLAQVFLLRGVMSPFAHAIFTGTTGLIMGFAARRWHAGASVLAFFIGLIPAMLLHNRWNSMGAGFLGEYIFIQVPIFVLAVVGIILLRVAEHRLTRQRLMEYSAAGWFSPAEVELLATPRGRRTALHWAAGYHRRPQMKAFLHAATQLAFIRQRILSGRDVHLHQAEEKQQLQRILSLRAAVAG